MSALFAIGLRVLGAVQKLPRWAWYVLGAVAGVALLWWLHVRAIDNAVAMDRAANAAAAKHVRDSLTVEVVRAKFAIAAAESRANAAWASRDSAVSRTKLAEAALHRSQQRLASAILTLPDSLAKIPAVDSLVRACNALAHDCEQLRRDVAAERETADSAKVATTRERAARIRAQTLSDSSLAKATAIIVHEQQKNAALSGRISKRAAVFWFLVARSAEAGARRLGRKP